MKIAFPKDLVVVDFESTYGQLEERKPVQIGAILLDRATLDEKKNFVSLIRADLSDVPPPHLAKLARKGFTQETLANAPSAAHVARDFVETFGKVFFFSSWVADLDRALFRKIMIAAEIDPSDFDYHVYDIWPLAYTHLLGRGYKGPATSEEMFQELGLPPRGPHNALEDCRYAASVLRKILST